MAERKEFGLAELQALLDSYGADRRRWPEPLRPSANALIEQNAAARKALKDAQELDDLLAGAGDAMASPELKARVLADASAPRRRFKLPSTVSFGSFWKPAATLAAAAVLGIALGALVQPPLPSTGELSLDGEIGELTMTVLSDGEAQQ